jgi:hypothetical protein
MDASMNIVTLIESSPISRLSATYNNRFLTKIQQQFSDQHQQLFVASFYYFLNFHPRNDFTINFDDIWSWMGFSQKINAKRVIDKNFILDTDYKIVTNTEKMHGGHNREIIMLNVYTFKLFCIKSETSKAKQIHDYFVKLEFLLHEIVQEETNELKEQLDQLKIQNQQQQQEMELMQVSRKVPTIYIYNTDHRIAHKPLLKIGVTQCLVDRIKPYKTTHPYGKVIFHEEVDRQINFKTMEHSVHSRLSQFKVQGEVFRLDVEEAITCVIVEHKLSKLFLNTNDAERKHEIKKLHDEFAQTNGSVKILHTCEVSTQTDVNEMDPITPLPLIHGNIELIAKFENYVQEHCIVRHDVQCSAKDILGQYRILSREARREITQALTDYLRQRFVYGRLKMDDDSVIMGFTGIMLKNLHYSKGFAETDEETFVFERCVFSPSGTALYKDICHEYASWKQNVGKPIHAVEDEINLKHYLKNCPYLLFETVWAPGGNGQGYYGLRLKRDMKSHQRSSSTATKVVKKDSNTGQILMHYDTIAQAASFEEISAAKMSRSIKNKVVFSDNYYYSKHN